MDSAIAAEEYGCVCAFDLFGPFDPGAVGEILCRLRSIARADDGSDAHAEGIRSQSAERGTEFCGCFSTALSS